mgnify:CR=1 FL=1
MTETEARIIITDYLKKISKETPPEYIGDDQQCYFYTVRYQVGYQNYGVLKETGKVPSGGLKQRGGTPGRGPGSTS